MKIVILEARYFTKQIFLLLLSVLGFSVCTMLLPGRFSVLIDSAIPNKDVGQICTVSGSMVILAVIMVALGFVIGLTVSQVSMGIGRNLGKKVFDKVQSFSAAEIDRFAVSSLISRTNNDINEIKNFLSQSLMMLLFAPILCVIGVFMSIITSPELSVVLFFSVPALLIALIAVVRYTMPLSEDIFRKTDRINLVTREKITGTRVIRAFGTMDFERNKFRKINEEFKKTNRKLENATALLLPLSVIILCLSVGAIFFIAYISKKNGNTSYQPGEVIAVVNYVLFIMLAIIMLTLVFMGLPRATACAKRVKEVLDTDPTILNPAEPKEGDGRKGRLEFRDVVFSYKGAEVPAVNHLSFQAKPGETVAIIGGTGMGKSSIINLIPRMYDVTEGQILLDGVDIRDYDIDSLRKKISFVPQKASLFKGTIDSNIRFGGEDPTDEKVEQAVTIAQSMDFVMGKKEGFNEPVAQGGSNFSGGQKQRLCIARALAREAEVYIFDDSFSALDFRTDKALRTALKEVTHDSVTMIVAQRISTIMDADRIIVIDRGNIMGIGTHKELLEKCDVYREIAASQLSEEELKNA